MLLVLLSLLLSPNFCTRLLDGCINFIECWLHFVRKRVNLFGNFEQLLTCFSTLDFPFDGLRNWAELILDAQPHCTRSLNKFFWQFDRDLDISHRLVPRHSPCLV